MTKNTPGQDTVRAFIAKGGFSSATNMKCRGENVILRVIHSSCTVVSRFPLHFMFYRGNLDYFSNSVAYVQQTIQLPQLKHTTKCHESIFHVHQGGVILRRKKLSEFHGCQIIVGTHFQNVTVLGCFLTCRRDSANFDCNPQNYR